MSTVELRFAALPGHVRTARMIATAVSRRAGAPDEAIDEIKLAVGEACARAVRVNQRHAPDALVRVRLIDSSDAFVVTVSDLGGTGDGHDPQASPPGAAGMGAVGGQPGGAGVPAAPGDDGDAADTAGWVDDIGLALIEGLADEMQIAPGENGVGTAVTMRWSIEHKPEGMAVTLPRTSPG
jgi:anti-sigma regulatory factor (Ser/Thr protein kinase)